MPGEPYRFSDLGDGTADLLLYYSRPLAADELELVSNIVRKHPPQKQSEATVQHILADGDFAEALRSLEQTLNRKSSRDKL